MTSRNTLKVDIDFTSAVDPKVFEKTVVDLPINWLEHAWIKSLQIGMTPEAAYNMVLAENKMDELEPEGGYLNEDDAVDIEHEIKTDQIVSLMPRQHADVTQAEDAIADARYYSLVVAEEALASVKAELIPKA